MNPVSFLINTHSHRLYGTMELITRDYMFITTDGNVYLLAEHFQFIVNGYC